MNKWAGVNIWASITRIILRNRISILLAILLLTVFMALQWKTIRFSFTEANLLPDDHPINSNYKAFIEEFGEEGNLIVIGIKDNSFFTPKNFNAWTTLMADLKKEKDVSLIISVDNLKKLQKNDSLQKFDIVSFIDQSKPLNKSSLDTIKNDLFNKMPFYEGLLFNKKNETIRCAIYLDKKIVNTIERKKFIFEKFIPKIEAFEKETNIDLHVSGMPYIRSLNAKSLTSEIGLFIGAALLMTSLIFYFFFRSIKTTFISVCIVIIGAMWSFGIVGILNYEITVLTALVPALVIIIGVPNCIFLTNKYHQECRAHNNQAKALVRVLTKVGAATLITNITTSFGFATFITTNNQLLKEFGVVTSINIMTLFVLCLLLIPIIYSYLPIPKEEQLGHLERSYVVSFMNWIQKTIKTNRKPVYIIASLIFIVSIAGLFQIKTSGSIIEDLPKKSAFFEDILFFEDEFDGVMPLEITIDTQRKKGVLKLSTLRKIDELQTSIEDIPQLSKPVSILNIVKYYKQTYYNGNPDFYKLPTAQEQGFILSYAKNTLKNTDENMLESYVSKNGQTARITVFMKDIGTGNMRKIEAKLQHKINAIFPPNAYKVTLTGKPYVFEKGTKYLLDNLISSLLLALLITAGLIYFMFRSAKMIVIALLPNLLPLLATAGIMGYFNIPLKPSTILVFGIAFGLSIDDTIRFLSQYRQELALNNWKINKSVFTTLKDSGLSMFYTSVVLFAGFSIFMLSSFGGTIALGGLIALTLLFGMLSNLMFLPSLLLSLEKSIANKHDFIKPKINIIYRIRNRNKASKKPTNTI